MKHNKNKINIIYIKSIKRNILNNLNVINDKNVSYILTTKLSNRSSGFLKLKVGIQENVYIKKKELKFYQYNSNNNFQSKRYLFSKVSFFSKIKTYTPKEDLLLKRASFQLPYKDPFNYYAYQRLWYIITLYIKAERVLSNKKGIVVGITYNNYIVNFDGLICNVQKSQSSFKLYDTVNMCFTYMTMTKVKKVKKINKKKLVRDSGKFLRKKYKVKNIFFKCRLLRKHKNYYFQHFWCGLKFNEIHRLKSNKLLVNYLIIYTYNLSKKIKEKNLT